MSRILISCLLLIFLSFSEGIAQVDSILMSNGNELVGKIKSMDKGVLVIETDFSDSDFKVEWEKIIGLRTQSLFLLSTDDAMKYYSTLVSVDSSRVIVYRTIFESDTILLDHIVYLNALKDRFIDRISISIDAGFDLTGSRNLINLTSSSSIGYTAENWMIKTNFQSLWSSQDETENIVRNEGDLKYRYVFPKKWYGTSTFSFLKNSEQNLDLRSNIQVGLGRFLVFTNTAFWGLSLGANRNLELYTNSESDSTINNRESYEGILGTEIDLFDIGDISLVINIMMYPSLTESGRIRSESNYSLKYDLPFDFYIKAGGSINFDNQPGSEVSKWDYVFNTGIGWEL